MVLNARRFNVKQAILMQKHTRTHTWWSLTPACARARTIIIDTYATHLTPYPPRDRSRVSDFNSSVCKMMYEKSSRRRFKARAQDSLHYAPRRIGDKFINADAVNR